MEALERALTEVEALEAIYDTAFTISNEDCLRQARESIECAGDEISAAAGNPPIPRLDVRLDLSTACGAGQAGVNQQTLILCVGLPPGYPESTAAQVSIQQWNDRTRHECEMVTRQLQHRADALLGQEAVMELVQAVQDATITAPQTLLNDENTTLNAAGSPAERIFERESEQGSTQSDALNDGSDDNQNGRRWIWVHHIKDTARRKAIIQEARECNLGGFLKYGYPGIVVVEGSQSDCDAFVSWVKGNKSRPGGFGRNWGHHVRGEINNIPVAKNQLPKEFVELEEMKDLGAACKECGVEDEFLAYVMQHN